MSEDRVKVAADTRAVSARATCLERCGFDEYGRKAKELAHAHVRETGHRVSFAANIITFLEPDEDVAGSR